MNKLIAFILSLLLYSSMTFSQCTLDFTTWNPTCTGSTDGGFTMSALNGQAPYSLELDGQTYPFQGNEITIESLGAGDYTAMVTDGADCNESISITLTDPPTMAVFVEVWETCEVESCIFVNVTGGTPPYVFTYMNGLTTPDPLNCQLYAGTHVVVVTDANGCEFIEEFDVWEIFLDVFITETPISCSSVELTAQGIGNPPVLQYNWSTGENSPSIVVNSSGDYEVTVTDWNGCFATSVYSYDGTNSGYFPALQPISCNGEVDGAIFANVPNDFNPVNITWTGVNGFTSNELEIAGLEAGQYSLTLEFADGCIEDFGPYEITEPLPLDIDIVSIMNLLCAGDSSGSIDIDVTGGIGGYSYQWNINLPNVPDLSNLSAGDYSVTVTDGNGCTISESFTVTEPAPLELAITGTPESCLGDGSANVAVTGGTLPYDYLWSNGETADSITNVIAGTYTVTVTDQNGCTVSSSYLIDSPIDIELSSTFTSCNMNDGTATVQVIGGATQPTFAWSNGQSAMTAVDLSPDWYSVTVTDEATDCQVHQNVQVLEDTICYVRISGYVYLDDVEQDCQVDATTTAAPYVKVFLGDGQLAFTNLDGYYEFTTDVGSYDLSIEYSSALDALCADPISVDASTWGQAYSDNNFYLKYAEDSDIQLKVIKFNARPGFQQNVRICLMNVGSVPRSGTLSYVHPEIQEFISSSPAADAYDMTSQTATWDFVDLPPGAIWIYTPKMLTPIGTDLGTPLAYGFYTDPIGNDLTPENNNIECSIEVTGSYDPNDKAVAPAGVGEEGIISMADSLLSYTIRFQNTGTDTAFTVLLRDTLDVDLIVQSVRPGPASHPYSVSVKEGNILEFLFENILLPDSTVNEEASNGFVIFDVLIRDDAPYGTVIENTAGIYFDFNPPIITNTVVNTIQMINALPELSEKDIALQLQPNPSQGATQLSYSLDEAEWVNISLLSLRGEQLKVIASGERQAAGFQQIKLEDLNLAAGIYFIKVETRSGGVGIVKLIQL